MTLRTFRHILVIATVSIACLAASMSATDASQCMRRDALLDYLARRYEEIPHAAGRQVLEEYKEKHQCILPPLDHL